MHRLPCKLIFWCVLFISCATAGYGQDIYRYTINLNEVKSDKVKVTLLCPPIIEASAIFVMPRVIPGSYSWKEYGRFLSSVKGFDSLGNELKIKRKKNIFYINENAHALKKIEYWVADTWDDKNHSKFIFQPGGSNIEANTNIVVNGHAFMGYFEGYKNLPFHISIEKPTHFFGSTWLKKETSTPDKDVFVVKNYEVLADNPIMYCKPDTASFWIDQTKIVVSSYSTTGLVRADSLAVWLKPLTTSLRNFLGKLPVSEYHFLFYFGTEEQLVKIKSNGGLSGYGALEHNHCSFYYLPEKPYGRKVKFMVQDVAAHEFLHIITPLNLHSEEIENFDFRNPKMSQHLWMYEGVTEYFSWLVRLQNNLVTKEEFFDEIRDKLQRSAQYGTYSFTEMSKHVLEPSYQEKYTDVYLKGAIMAMLLDQLIIKKSNGTKSLKTVMLELMNKYGAEKAFKDDELFKEFENHSYPEVAQFFKRYISNVEDLPLQTYLEWFGYNYIKEERLNCYYIGYFSYRLNSEEQIEITSVYQAPQLVEGDKITHLNDNKITDSTFQSLSEKYIQFNNSSSVVKLTLLRNGEKMNIFLNPLPGYGVKKHVITDVFRISPEQLALRKAWLKGIESK